MNRITQTLDEFNADLPDGAEIKFMVRGRKLAKVMPQDVNIPISAGKDLVLKITNQFILVGDE
jgi:hypothetical protein